MNAQNHPRPKVWYEFYSILTENLRKMASISILCSAVDVILVPWKPLFVLSFLKIDRVESPQFRTYLHQHHSVTFAINCFPRKMSPDFVQAGSNIAN